MKKLNFLIAGIFLAGSALARPQVPGFTDNFTVNFPTFNGQALQFQMYGHSDKGSGLEFENNGCTTTATGTQCQFNIHDKVDFWGDDGNTFILLSAFPKPYVCQLIIFDGTEVSPATIANSNCNPNSLQVSMTSTGDYSYNINVTNNN